MNKPNFKKICLMYMQQLTNFPYIEKDFDALTDYGLLCKVVDYLNEVIKNNNTQNESITNLYNAFIELKEYVDNLDLQEEVNNKLDEMAESGELNQIISSYLKLPSSNSFELNRIGRKLIFGTNSNSSNYDSNGVANGMQGGCVIDENTVAYMLWDNININLNKNKLIKMNINTGEILNEMNFNFGWCNSMAYKDGLLYVAVRGTTNNDVATNNGDIKVIDANTLLLVNEYTLPINVNAISIYDNTLYALQENTPRIYLYNLDGTPKNESITLNLNIANIYNQNIKVSDNYIYLISTQPTNLLNIFTKNGTHLKTYNIPKYGGIYLIGELQWIDIFSNNLIIGSIVQKYEESINQFFKFNLSQNIESYSFQKNYALSLNVDSSKNNYNPDGTLGNEFSTINEIDCLNINNILCLCNNKNYKYTELSNHFNMRIENANFTEGIYLQYGNYYLLNCNIKSSINNTIDACLFTRYNKIYLSNVVFDATGKNYCINSVNSTEFKFANPSFTNFLTSIFSSNIPSDIINVNNLSNIPYIPRTYNREYNLMSNGVINQYKEGLYSFNTSLSQSQIEELFFHAEYIIVEYIGLNKTTIQQVKFEKNNNNNYTISDFTIAGANFNLRCSKAILYINKNGIQISSNKCSQIVVNNNTPTFTHLSSEDSSSIPENFIQIKAVKLICT